MLRHVTGDATLPPGDGPKIITHCCNDIGAWGAGFVLPLGNRWPRSKEAYLEWFKVEPSFDPDFVEVSGPPQLGEVQLVLVGPKLWVANLIGQHQVGIGDDNRPPIRYDAIRTGLVKVCRYAKIHEASVHMPKMGAGLAGGNWGAIEQLVKTELVNRGIEVTVYSLPGG